MGDADHERVRARGQHAALVERRPVPGAEGLHPDRLLPELLERGGDQGAVLRRSSAVEDRKILSTRRGVSGLARLVLLGGTRDS